MTDEGKVAEQEGEEQKTAEKPQGNYTEVINGEKVTTVVTNSTGPATDDASVTNNPRKETQVKITVATDAPMEEVNTEAAH